MKISGDQHFLRYSNHLVILRFGLDLLTMSACFYAISCWPMIGWLDIYINEQVYRCTGVSDKVATERILCVYISYLWCIILCTWCLGDLCWSITDLEVVFAVFSPRAIILILPNCVAVIQMCWGAIVRLARRTRTCSPTCLSPTSGTPWFSLRTGQCTADL